MVTYYNKRGTNEWEATCGFFDTTALVLLGVTILALVVLSSPLAGASTRQHSVEASVTVPSTCSMTATVNSVHTATMVNGMYSASSGSPYENGIGKTTLQTFCNDSGGYAIYAVGYDGAFCVR